MPRARRLPPSALGLGWVGSALRAQAAPRPAGFHSVPAPSRASWTRGRWAAPQAPGAASLPGSPFTSLPVPPLSLAAAGLQPGPEGRRLFCLLLHVVPVPLPAKLQAFQASPALGGPLAAGAGGQQARAARPPASAGGTQLSGSHEYLLLNLMVASGFLGP